MWCCDKVGSLIILISVAIAIAGKYSSSVEELMLTSISLVVNSRNKMVTLNKIKYKENHHSICLQWKIYLNKEVFLYLPWSYFYNFSSFHHITCHIIMIPLLVLSYVASIHQTLQNTMCRKILLFTQSSMLVMQRITDKFK